MSEPPPYRLERRPLRRDDEVWVERFTGGDDYWEIEVAEFLRVDALRQLERGYNMTTLFSFPGDREVVGFIAAAPAELKLKTLQAALPYMEREEGLTKVPVVVVPLPYMEREEGLTKVPVVVVPYFGVARRYQGNNYGLEIHTRLLESLTQSMAAPRFIYLQCWQDNARALRFYQRLGYEEFDNVEDDRPDGQGSALRLKLAYDRFRLPGTD